MQNPTPLNAEELADTDWMFDDVTIVAKWEEHVPLHIKDDMGGHMFCTQTHTVTKHEMDVTEEVTRLRATIDTLAAEIADVRREIETVCDDLRTESDCIGETRNRASQEVLMNCVDTLRALIDKPAPEKGDECPEK